jgi:hypothetical protein
MPGRRMAVGRHSRSAALEKRTKPPFLTGAARQALRAADPHSGLGRRPVTRPIRFGPWLLAALFAPMIVSPPFRANAAESAAFHPSTTIPNATAEASSQYYILFLKWSQDALIGPVTARATYLDPPLYLAWLRQESPNIDQAAFEQKIAGFPKILRFRVAYQATDRASLHAKDWKVTLQTAEGTSISAVASKRIAPADLKSGPNGDFWEDDWDYQFPASEGLLADSSKGFSLLLSGPAGEGKVNWSFGATQAVTRATDGYVVYLGSILSGLCIALLAALYLTRPPRASIT